MPRVISYFHQLYFGTAVVMNFVYILQ